MDRTDLVVVPGTVVTGHGVASGIGGDHRFPEGTLALQVPVFARLGVDLTGYHLGTINVDTSPVVIIPSAPRRRLEHVEWLAGYPAETFSFVDAAIAFEGNHHDALLYYPHPDTKPEHDQPATVIELLACFIPGLEGGDRVEVGIAADQVHVA